MRTLGLLGGMSWESTLLYYRLINQHVRDKRPGTLHSCPMILHSFDFASIASLQSQGRWTELAQLLVDAAAGLKRARVECIVITTNTMHKVADRIATEVDIEVLHIADLTAETIVTADKRRVALLGTRYTMEQDFYKGRLTDKYGLEVLVPDAQGMDAVHNIIYNELCNGIVREESRSAYVGIIDGLVARGADSLILGCTEITMLIRQEDVQVPVFDTTTIHAHKVAEWALGGLGNIR